MNNYSHRNIVCTTYIIMHFCCSTDELRTETQCSSNVECVPTYSFHHSISLTSNVSHFEVKLICVCVGTQFNTIDLKRYTQHKFSRSSVLVCVCICVCMCVHVCACVCMCVYTQTVVMLYTYMHCV